MAQFVLLEHDTRPRPTADAPAGAVHWDLMLEVQPGGPLATWRLAQNPVCTATPIACERIGDHRREYLEYEGEISGDRGRVRRIDRGELRVQRGEPGEIRAAFAGAALCGAFVLRESAADWLLERAAPHRT